MKAVRFIAPEKIEISQVPLPDIADDEVLARVAYAGFCGTDIDLLTGEMPHIKNGFTTYPLIPGHEWSGVVEKIGYKVKGFKEGDRVTSDVSIGCGKCEFCKKGRYNLCPNRVVVGSYRNKNGVFAEYVNIPERHLYKVPDNVSLEEAAMAEPAATAVYAIKRARISAGDNVFIIGDGPIGQLVMQMANNCGAVKTLMVGSWDEKLAVAKQSGCSFTMNYKRDDVLKEIYDNTDGKGADIIVETSGNQRAFNQAIQALRPGGKIVLVSWYSDVEVSAQINNFIGKDAEMIGTLGSPNSFDAALAYMASGKLNVKPLITHIEPLEKIESVITMIRAKKEYRNKVLLKP